MGGNGSCPECPKCEEKTCPACPECPTCNTDAITDGDIDYYPVKGTAATIIVRKIHMTSAFKDINDMEAQMFYPLLKLYGVRNIPYVFALTDKKIMNKLSWHEQRAFDVDPTINEFDVIVAALSCPPGDDLVYNNADGYQVLRKISAAFNAIFKKYANYYVLFAVGESVTSVINGSMFTDRFDKQELIVNAGEEDIFDGSRGTLYGGGSSDERILGPMLTEDTKAGDLNIRFIGIADKDTRLNKKTYHEATLFPPGMKQEQESFRPSGGGSCLSVVLIVVLAVCFFMILFMRDNRKGRRIDTYYTEDSDDIQI